MKKNHSWTIIAILLVSAGCNSGHGTDSLFGRQTRPRTPVSDCIKCHNSTNSPTLDPLVTNGSGTYGKHIKHVQQRRILCERCHSGYMNTATHMNGTFDRGDPLVSLVSMSITGPAGAWDPATGSCSGVACHDSTTLAWYGTNTWTTPAACTDCHASSFSPALDPTLTNGTPPGGRHGKHVSARNIECERCHYQYPARTTHANGVLDTPDPAVNITQFNIVATSGSWTGDTGAQTGQCANISCHGTDTLPWYGVSAWTLPAVCTTCHASSYASQLDPLVTNGSGLSGKHGKHVTSYGYDCEKCHLNYPAQASHASGIMDTQDPSSLILAFDSTNPTGTWINDTGAQTGSCSSLNCHNADTDWYTLAGVTLPACSVCHVNPVGVRRQVMGAAGDFGANLGMSSHHVTRGPGSDPLTDQCLVCHEMSVHMGGTVRVKNADSGAAIVYSSATPSTLEPFCLSCHDMAGAAATFISGGSPTNPFNDGSIIGNPPYVSATRINSSWTSTNGHGPNGNHAVAKQLTCLGTGQPGTGCHGSGGSVNAHGSVNQVLSARPFKYDNGYSYIASDFDLCFTCHASYPGFTKEDILGVKAGGILDWEYGTSGGQGPNTWNPPYYIFAVTTHFADHNETGGAYNDPTFWGENMNLHWWHLGWSTDFRGTGVVTSYNCVNCHDVHGSPTPYGATYAELGYSNIFPDAVNKLGRMSDNAYLTTQLGVYPTYCTFNCHVVQGTTRAWFYPIAE